MTSEAQKTTYKINSAQYGELEYKEEQVFTFQKGLIGLEKKKHYALLPISDSPLYILHHLEEDTSFIIVPAAQVVKDYEFDIDPEVLQLLEAQQPEDILLFLIVNLADNQLFVNLKAPLLLSPGKRSGVQYVIHDREYPIRYSLSMKGKE